MISEANSYESTSDVKTLIESAARNSGMSERELGRSISASKDQIYRWKKGHSRLPENIRADLLKITGVNPATQTTESTQEVSRFVSVLKEMVTDGDPHPMQDLVDQEVEKCPFLTQNGCSGLNATVIIEQLSSFGINIPTDPTRINRSSMHQVKTSLHEYLQSYDTLMEWVSRFLVDERNPANAASRDLNEALDRVNQQLPELAAAKMNTDSITKDFIDRAFHSGKAETARAEMRAILKDFIEVYLQAGNVLMRNPFRIVVSSNDSLFYEMRDTDTSESADITQYFSLAERTILREVQSLKKLVSKQA